jgi:hypothetical protein
MRRFAWMFRISRVLFLRFFEGVIVFPLGLGSENEASDIDRSRAEWAFKNLTFSDTTLR